MSSTVCIRARLRLLVPASMGEFCGYERRALPTLYYPMDHFAYTVNPMGNIPLHDAHHRILTTFSIRLTSLKSSLYIWIHQKFPPHPEVYIVPSLFDSQTHGREREEKKPIYISLGHLISVFIIFWGSVCPTQVELSPLVTSRMCFIRLVSHLFVLWRVFVCNCLWGE